MSLSTDGAIFSPAIAGNPFYSGRGGNWWVLKAKFPRRVGTYCENHSYWNVSNGLSLRGGWIWEQYCVHSQEQMCSKVERAKHFNSVVVFETICLTKARDISLRSCHMVSCSNCAVKKRLNVRMLCFHLSEIDSVSFFIVLCAHVVNFLFQSTMFFCNRNPWNRPFHNKKKINWPDLVSLHSVLP